MSQYEAKKTKSKEEAEPTYPPELELPDTYRLGSGDEFENKSTTHQPTLGGDSVCESNAFDPDFSEPTVDFHLDENDEYFWDDIANSGTQFGVEAFPRLNLALLAVNHQIRDEALPIFFGGVAFLVDGSPLQTIHFFRELPRTVRRNIRTLTICSSSLYADDYMVRQSWSTGQIDVQLSKPMDTPLGSYMARCLPKLECVYLYVPYGGFDDFYCSYEPLEMLKLIKYGRIETLNYYFCGTEVAQALKGGIQDVEQL